MKSVAWLPALLLTACYGAAPPKPPVIPLPPPQDGARDPRSTPRPRPPTRTSRSRRAPARRQGRRRSVVHGHSLQRHRAGDAHEQRRVVRRPADHVRAVQGDDRSSLPGEGRGGRRPRPQVPAREHAALHRPRMLATGLIVGPIISAEGGGGVGTAVTTAACSAAASPTAPATSRSAAATATRRARSTTASTTPRRWAGTPSRAPTSRPRWPRSPASSTRRTRTRPRPPPRTSSRPRPRARTARRLKMRR